MKSLQVDECFHESVLDNVFGVFSNADAAEGYRKNPSLMALEEGFKRTFISTFRGSDELLLRG